MNPRQQAELARVAALEAALARSRKQAVMAARLAALHKTGRDQAREALHEAQATIARVRALHHVVQVAYSGGIRVGVRVGAGAIPVPVGTRPECSHCGQPWPWPCPTIQALEQP